ncbi:MAG: hypothetical protein ABI183_11560 [Polyangiaceae bacterium]
MPPRETQISAFVSDTTKDEIERYTRATGVKKNHLVEAALAHHLIALRELPADIIVHPRLVVTMRSGRAVVTRLETKPKPTAKLRALMNRADD